MSLKNWGGLADMNEKGMEKLKKTQEMDADKHDGSYELMRVVVEEYRNIDESDLDYNDLNSVYLMSVGTWKHGFSVKKKTIEKSHLSNDSKTALYTLLDVLEERSKNGEYGCHKDSARGLIGMFGTGFYSFEKKTNEKSVRAFIRMLVDISDMDDDEEMYKRAELVLKKGFRGMRAASASMVLHCLKPYTFPILNSNMGSKNIFA